MTETQNTGAAVETAGITFSYGAMPVLNEVDLVVEMGEIVGIIGPNGSGKTTLLKIISRTLRAQRGDVRILGRDIETMSSNELARIVAVVPQSSFVAFPFTAAEIVLMGRTPHLGGLPFERKEDRDIALRAMTATDTLDFADRRITELSGGEMQRVIIARALAQQPRILLLDEPTAHLDLRHQIAIYEIIARLNDEEGMTVIVVSHDLNLAALHCRRLIMFAHGGIVAAGPPAEVITSENIERIYGVHVPVTRTAVTDQPIIVPTRIHKESVLP